MCLLCQLSYITHEFTSLILTAGKSLSVGKSNLHMKKNVSLLYSCHLAKKS